MSKPKILLQLDVDEQPSTFDAVVAIDAGVDQLLTRGGVDATDVTPLVHGLMFTRGGDDLRRSAIFVGGSDVGAASRLLEAIRGSFFGPVRVSVLLDANGCNTTAAAAVVLASKHAPLNGSRAVVLGGTGPVGMRAAQMLACEGTEVTLTSRNLSRAKEAADSIRAQCPNSTIHAAQIGSPDRVAAALDGAQMVISCGAAGIELVGQSAIESLSSLAVAIDLNAVPPAGIGGIEATDKAEAIKGGRSDAVGYGAIGVGGFKMKVHRAAIEKLFEANDQILDAAEIYAIAKQIE